MTELTMAPAPQQRRATRLRRSLTPTKILWNAFHYTVLTCASFLVIAPLYIAFISSFKKPIEMLRGEKTDWPQEFGNLENYAKFIERGEVGIAFFNTAFVIVISLAILILMGTMAAYAIDRFRFPGRKLILILYVVVMAIPPITTQV